MCWLTFQYCQKDSVFFFLPSMRIQNLNSSTVGAAQQTTRQLPEDKLSGPSLRQPADALSETWPSSLTHGNHTARRRNTGAPSAEAPSRWQTPGSTGCPLPESECGDRRWLSPAWGVILKASRRSKRLSQFSLTAGWIGAGAALLPTAQLSQW